MVNYMVLQKFTILKVLLEMEGVYQKDRRHGIWKFYKEGKLIKEKDFTRRSKNPYKKQ